MKNFIETLKNIWKIEELRNRILTTLGFLLIYRLGSFVVLPGLDAVKLQKSVFASDEGLMGLLNMFTGGALSKASIMALGIMPYISASIVIQLMTMAVPYLQKLQKDGESGRTKINQITRYLTVLITCFQAPGYLFTINEAVINPGFFSFTAPSILILVTGTMFAMWLGEKITDRGVGNGISILIMVGIIAVLPESFLMETGRVKALIILVELLIMMGVILASVLLVQGVRRIPIQYAKRGASGQIAAARQYLPLKVNAAGVMPIIFAQAIMFVPITLVSAGGLTDSEGVRSFLDAFSDFSGFWYNFVFGFLIIIFTYFYTAITVNTNQMADDLKRNGGFVPGVKPGKDTAVFLDGIMSRIVLPGSVFLALIAILPAFAMNAGVGSNFAQFFGGTSLLIMVGVVLDTLQQIEGYLLNRHYDGLMKSGRLSGGRSGM